MITSAGSAPPAALLRRVRAQYREMPALKLTKPQATRLFAVAPSMCDTMLRALVMENRNGHVCAIDTLTNEHTAQLYAAGSV